MDDRSAPVAEAQWIADALWADGATELDVSTNPVWIIGRAPNGQCLQIMWHAHACAYQVSRWIPAPVGTEALGTFPDWWAAVACALRVKRPEHVAVRADAALGQLARLLWQDSGEPRLP